MALCFYRVHVLLWFKHFLKVTNSKKPWMDTVEYLNPKLKSRQYTVILQAWNHLSSPSFLFTTPSFSMSSSYTWQHGVVLLSSLGSAYITLCFISLKDILSYLVHWTVKIINVYKTIQTQYRIQMCVSKWNNISAA